jgi:hypothetical protein
MMNPIDYGLSYVHGSLPDNRVRFWVESRTRVVDEKDGRTEDFCQCGSCKAEETFAEKNLLRGGENAYDFLPVFGPTHSVIFRRFAFAPPDTDYRQIAPSDSWWGKLVFRLQEAAPVHVLDASEKVREATHAGLPLVVQTELWNEQTRMRAIVEFPVKTMNINDARNMYQADTGPVVFPDLSKRYDRTVESLSLAYVAVNASHFADFIIETRTPISVDGKHVCDVYHYSETRSLSATNTLFCIGDI